MKILIVDSTGRINDAAPLASVLFYIVESKMFISDGLSWKGDMPFPEPFRMKTYRHNLIGEKEKWQRKA